MFEGKTWWIVGASDGLGRALDAEGATLILSARGAEALEALAGELRDARPLVMDVTDAASVRAATEAAGTPDGMIYCVGLYEPMRATDWQPGAAEAMTEANFTGALRVLAPLVPAMVARGHGHLALIGSLAGFRGLPGAIGYGASKAALMHLAENLRVDLRDTGVTVSQINPGFIRTRLTAKNDFHMPQLLEPEDAAARTIRAIRSGRFSTSYPAPFAWLFSWGQYLPLGLFHRLFK
jgi:NADP-dependent 3-hydroxy acid dehydrogenase YdfG